MQLQQLVDAINHIQTKGRFAASGVVAGAPLLAIEGVGTLSLPVVPLLLPHLRGAGTDAPYGRGADTIVDASVRRCTQIDVERLGVPAGFANALKAITQAAAQALGVDGEVVAHLYKLLVYGPGDFFAPHRDTEKEDGMFGTLVVTLP
jgi:hypothetical protein